jgi:hypothetical protein
VIIASEAVASSFSSLGPSGHRGSPLPQEHTPRLDPSLPSPSRKPATDKEAHIRGESW